MSVPLTRIANFSMPLAAMSLVAPSAFATRMGRPAPACGPVSVPSPLMAAPNTALAKEVDAATVEAFKQAVEKFCEAALKKKRHCDEKAVQAVLTQVHQLGLQQSFAESVLAHANALGMPAKNIPEILQRQLLGNPLLRPFKRAAYLECLDYWQNGKNTYQPTAWEYRLNGVWRSFIDFGDMLKSHPVLGTGVIGIVAYLGHKKPFLGAVAGSTILLSSATSLVKNEVKAHNMPGMDEKKAEAYRSSGESMLAFLLTLTGIDGIYQGLCNGIKTFSQVTPDMKALGTLHQAAARAKNAIMAEMSGHGMSPFTAFRFVLGLLDDSLLPLNYADEKFKTSKPAASCPVSEV